MWRKQSEDIFTDAPCLPCGHTAIVNLHHMIVTDALPAMAPGHDHLDCYPCLQLNSRAVLTYIHLRHRCPETPAWLLFIDTRQTPLFYFHQLLLALGISPHAIAGLAYTTNGGQFSDPLQHATNILLQLSNQQDWYSSTATKCINHGTIVTNRTLAATPIITTTLRHAHATRIS